MASYRPGYNGRGGDARVPGYTTYPHPAPDYQPYRQAAAYDPPVTVAYQPDRYDYPVTRGYLAQEYGDQTRRVVYARDRSGHGADGAVRGRGDDRGNDRFDHPDRGDKRY